MRAGARCAFDFMRASPEAESSTELSSRYDGEGEGKTAGSIRILFFKESGRFLNRWKENADRVCAQFLPFFFACSFFLLFQRPVCDCTARSFPLPPPTPPLLLSVPFFPPPRSRYSLGHRTFPTRRAHMHMCTGGASAGERDTTFPPVCGSLITIRLVNGEFHYFSPVKLGVHALSTPRDRPAGRLSTADNAAAVINSRVHARPSRNGVVNVKGKWHVRRQITFERYSYSRAAWDLVIPPSGLLRNQGIAQQ